MPTVRFTKEDLLSRNQLPPSWYKLKVSEVGEWKPGKSDPEAQVIECKFVVSAPEQFVGTPIRHWFSEKSMDRLSDFIKCFVSSGQLETGKDYEVSTAKGREIMAYCKYEPLQRWNVIEQFKPVSSATGGAA